MHRFFIAEGGLRSLGIGAQYALPERVARQVRDVLHLHPGEQLVLFEQDGVEQVCEITASSRKGGVEVQIVAQRAGKPESPVKIVLCQGLLKSARFETILEKGTELGVSHFVPMLCRRSMAGLEEAGSAKVQRWQRIVQEATEQCGRIHVPELLPIRPLLHALNDIPQEAIALMPWEEEQGVSLHQALQEARNAYTQDSSGQLTVWLFIGPEGGLMEEEVVLAKRHGVRVVTLGPRILRAETAAIATVANVMYELESLF